MGGDTEVCPTEVKKASTDVIIFPGCSWIAAPRFLQLQLIHVQLQQHVTKTSERCWLEWLSIAAVF